jgi:hypothetical protein
MLLDSVGGWWYVYRMNNNDLLAANDRAAAYGVRQDNPLLDPTYHESVDHTEPMTLREVQDAGGRVTRLRMLTDRGCPFLDISYIHATLPDGRIVSVLGTSTQPSKRNIKGSLIEWARREGFNAKALGMLDRENWSILWG